MSIYTKTGDKGTTSLYDGVRVKKDSDKVEAYGTIDELNSFVSLAEKKVKSDKIREKLQIIQNQLFLLAGEVASQNLENLAKNSDVITVENIEQLENWIDIFTGKLPKINSFILPGRTESAAQLHVARAVCRRAERRIIYLAKKEKIRPEIIQYLNRLSDCFYIFARAEDENQYEEELINRVISKYLKATRNSQTILLSNSSDYLFNKASTIIERAIAKAYKMKTSITVAIVDASGNLIAKYRMKDALLVSIELAQKKAYTAVAMKDSTYNLSQASLPNQPLYQIETNTEGQIVTFAGGIPIKREREIIGAVGVSGGTVEEDQKIAEYAVNLEGDL